MNFPEVLARLHDTQKLRWEGGGDITGKEFTVAQLKKWDHKGEHALVSGEISLSVDGNKISIIKHNCDFSFPDNVFQYEYTFKGSIVIFTGTLEFI